VEAPPTLSNHDNLPARKPTLHEAVLIPKLSPRYTRIDAKTCHAENPDPIARHAFDQNSLLNEMTPGSPRLLSNTITGNLLPDSSITHHPPPKTAAQKQHHSTINGNLVDTIGKRLFSYYHYY